MPEISTALIIKIIVIAVAIGGCLLYTSLHFSLYIFKVSRRKRLFHLKIIVEACVVSLIHI